MKILILTISFLILGAMLVQEQEVEIESSRKMAKSSAVSLPLLIASDIPKRSVLKPQNMAGAKWKESYPLTSHDPAWEQEMFMILMAYDPDNGEAIFTSYVMEKERHEQEFNQSLEVSLNMLSDLNGQSGYSKQKLEIEVAELEEEHSEKVKIIMGDHYDYLQEQKELFRSPSEE